MVEIAIIVVSYNTRELLQKCLRSIEQQSVLAEVVVIDNASKDGSAEMVKRDFPGMKLIRNQTNRGFAAANNQGFAATRTPYIMMLNSDTELPTPMGDAPSILAAFPDYLRVHLETGVVAPKLVNSRSVLQQSASWSEPTLLTLFLEYTLLNRLLYRLFPSWRYPGKLLLSRQELERPQTVGDLIGACLVFPRKLLECIGTLDERFFFFLEETDFNYRARKAGFALRYLPESAVLHHWGGSIDQGSSLSKRFSHYYPSLYKFFTKYHGWVYAGLAYAEAVVLSLGTLVLSVLLLLPAGASAPFFGCRFLRSVLAQLKIYSSVLGWHLGFARMPRR